MIVRLQVFYRDPNAAGVFDRMNASLRLLCDALREELSERNFDVPIRLQYSGHSQGDWFVGESFRVIRSNFELLPQVGLSPYIVETCVFHFLEAVKLGDFPLNVSSGELLRALCARLDVRC